MRYITKWNIHEHGGGGLREAWIDDFLSHEGANKSVGNTKRNLSRLLEDRKSSFETEYP